MPFAASLSQHPVTAHAVGEVVGDVLERLGAAPDIAMLFTTPHHAGALEDAAGAVRAILSPGALLGGAGSAVVGTAREVEDAPGVVLWAARTGPAALVRLEAETVGEAEVVISGWPAPLPFAAQALVLLGDPFSFPARSFFDHLNATHGGLSVVGGMASAARGPGGNRMVLDDRVFTSGAVGALFGPGVAVETVVSQGCRPIGPPLAVTRAEGNVIYELAGAPALDRLSALLAAARGAQARDLVAAIEVGPSDFLAHNVLGGNKERGAVVVDQPVELGAIVQFQLRDATAAGADLLNLLRRARRGAARPPQSALLFTGNGRWTRMFASPDHDAMTIDEVLGPIATAGLVTAGEFAPLGGRSYVLDGAASIALLRDAWVGS